MPDRQVVASTVRRAGRLARPSTLRSLSREAAWRARPRPLPKFEATWQPDERLLSTATVVWPDRYSWPAQAARVESIRVGLETLVRVRRADLFSGVPEGAIGIVPFLLEAGDRHLSIAIDYGDDIEVDPKVLAAYDLVFKMQYLLKGYGSDRVVPGGYIPGGPALYQHLPHVLALRGRVRPNADVYCRFGKDKSVEVRTKAIELLTRQDVLRFRGGFGRVRYAESLVESVKSRVCIDLPGLGPFCFRLVDYLAVGATVVAFPHICSLPLPLEEGRHVVYCRPDLSDLIEIAAGLRSDPVRAERLGREALAYFQGVLDYRQLARYYLTAAFERL